VANPDPEHVCLIKGDLDKWNSLEEGSSLYPAKPQRVLMDIA
jgi:hypothetical protein